MCVSQGVLHPTYLDQWQAERGEELARERIQSRARRVWLALAIALLGTLLGAAGLVGLASRSPKAREVPARWRTALQPGRAVPAENRLVEMPDPPGMVPSHIREGLRQVVGRRTGEFNISRYKMDRKKEGTWGGVSEYSGTVGDHTWWVVYSDIHGISYIILDGDDIYTRPGLED